MKLDRHTRLALRRIAYRNDTQRLSWSKFWSKKSVEKLIAAGYVEQRFEGAWGVWITDAGRSALREHQEGNG